MTTDIQQLTVAAIWANFREAVVPKEASETQVSEMQVAFYAGVTSILTVMRKIGENDQIDEETGARLMFGLEREVQRYTVEMMAADMARDIARATGTKVLVKVHDVTKPSGGREH
jgi:hypothetical protein